MSRYAASIAATERALRVTPGAAQTMSKAPDRFPRGAYPAFLKMGRGARVWDVDGHEYVDYICGLGAVPLGYAYPGVTNAIIEAMEDGLISASLPTEREAEIAERLCAIVPCGQDHGMVRFVKTGSEACAAAVRIARRATGRDLVIVVGYHGWHDWVQVTSDPHPGIPNLKAFGRNGQVEDVTLRVPYNDPEAIALAMEDCPVAAVMLEPTLLEPPQRGYLQAVVDLCRQHGALSIFDEMVMGFRWARAGGQEYFGVTPDMAVYGKGLANGFPLACIIGPERIMRNADVISGTFGGEVLSLAAAGAVLDAYRFLEPTAAQWARGMDFMQICSKLGIPMIGAAVHPKITYTGRDMAVFLQETARHGILLHPGGFNISAALTKDDMATTIVALVAGRDAVQAGVPLEGAMPQPPAFLRSGT